METIIFSTKFACPESGFTIEEIEPRLFSFNSPYGACEECEGIGIKLNVDPKLVVPDEKKTIADGLAAAEKGQQSLENAKVEIDKLLLGGKDEAKNIISMAEKRADDIVDEANQKAAQESLNKIKIAEQEIEQLANKVKSDLKNDLSALVIEGTQSILKKEVDKKAHDQIIEDLIRRI